MTTLTATGVALYKAASNVLSNKVLLPSEFEPVVTSPVSSYENYQLGCLDSVLSRRRPTARLNEVLARER